MKYDKKKVSAILKKTGTTEFDFQPEFWEKENWLDTFMDYLENNEESLREFEEHRKRLIAYGFSDKNLDKWIDRKEKLAREFKPALIEKED